MILAAMFLLSTPVVAQPEQPEQPVQEEIPIVRLSLNYYCMPTKVVEGQMAEQGGLSVTYLTEAGKMGVYQIWTGEQNGNEVWVLMLKAPNGLSCKMDDGIKGGAKNAPEPTTSETLEDKMKKLK